MNALITFLSVGKTVYSEGVSIDENLLDSVKRMAEYLRGVNQLHKIDEARITLIKESDDYIAAATR